MKSSTLAVLLTCHNRKHKTLDCLEALYNQSVKNTVKLCIYLVDDGSTDGTTEAILQVYPQTKVLQGDGNLYWTGGMQLAFKTAIQSKHDFYLWLNDDTELYPTAIDILLNTSEQVNSSAIIVGSTQDPDSSQFTYGGVLKGNWMHPCKFRWQQPTAQPQSCDTMNGNCVLIPHAAAELVGGLDSTFRHYAADFDYGLRAKQKGCEVWIAPNYVGTCVYNHPKARAALTKSSLGEQLDKLEQPKGLATQDDVILHPFWEWKAFTERHAGLLWPLYWLLPYRRIVWSTLFNRRKELSI
jgi:GT2 family glycosyltransferase